MSIQATKIATENFTLRGVHQVIKDNKRHSNQLRLNIAGSVYSLLHWRYISVITKYTLLCINLRISSIAKFYFRACIHTHTHTHTHTHIYIYNVNIKIKFPKYKDTLLYFYVYSAQHLRKDYSYIVKYVRNDLNKKTLTYKDFIQRMSAYIFRC